jgi:uncharacterized protein YgiB involved in biofilm formation
MLDRAIREYSEAQKQFAADAPRNDTRSRLHQPPENSATLIVTT